MLLTLKDGSGRLVFYLKNQLLLIPSFFAGRLFSV
ncbi:hypothetical protein PT2222_130034 [Paraburkholderia tropica]